MQLKNILITFGFFLGIVVICNVLIKPDPNQSLIHQRDSLETAVYKMYQLHQDNEEAKRLKEEIELHQIMIKRMTQGKSVKHSHFADVYDLSYYKQLERMEALEKKIDSLRK